MARVRYTGEAVVVVPVGGGLAVAPGQVVDVPTEIAKRLVASGRFETVRRARRASTPAASG